MRPGVTPLAVCLLPALLFVALHGPALDYDLVWTDEPELVQGTILRPPGRIASAFAEPLHAIDDPAARVFAQPYYRPLQVVTASLLASRVGREPRVFRSVSLALGAATAALFSGLVLALLRRPGAALFAGAVWAAHPAGLEIYVWVGGLSAALAFLFVVASVGCGVGVLLHPRRRPRHVFGALSLVFLGLGLLSKENAAVVPGLQLAATLGLLARARAAGDPWRGHLAPALGWLGAQAALVAAYLFLLRPAVLGTALPGSEPIGGSLATQWASSLALWPELFAWLVLPLSSTTSDVVRVVDSPTDPLAWLGGLLLLGSAVGFVALLRRGHGVAAFGLAWIWIAFLPTSGLAPLLHARAERNLFLPLFGAVLLLACAAAPLRARLPAPALVALALLAVVGLAERTWARQPDWRSSRALFERDVAREPRYREGRMNLVLAYVKAGELDRAKQQVDALLGLRRPQGWTSYALEANLLEMACRVNRAVGADADTVRAVEALPPAGGLQRMPGFRECLAESLAAVGRAP
ncbi:MAG: hypothetical protein ACQGVC_15515 [Myxococcota bacterium]